MLVIMTIWKMLEVAGLALSEGNITETLSPPRLTNQGKQQLKIVYYNFDDGNCNITHPKPLTPQMTLLCSKLAQLQMQADVKEMRMKINANIS